ncbi:hypothetical protein [Streptomyces sp. NPDC088707]|uniref:hypothetical protein n=1 Tax=Streptomyces sp. NPDC088707 TaxID=3365871 RepID=UPI00383010F4
MQQQGGGEVFFSQTRSGFVSTQPPGRIRWVVYPAGRRSRCAAYGFSGPSTSMSSSGFVMITAFRSRLREASHY